jgi:hypothetical protein
MNWGCEMKSYERSTGESDRAYRAYCIYQELGIKRTLKGAYDRYRVEMGIVTPLSPSRNPNKPPGFFQNWSTKFKWIQRIADFDRDNEAAARSIIQQRERDRYFEQADLLRTQTEAAGFGILDTSMKMLAALNRIASQLANLKDRKIADYTQREIDLILHLPSALRSIANCASGGVSMAADGLALTGVIEQVQKNLK